MNRTDTPGQQEVAVSFMFRYLNAHSMDGFKQKKVFNTSRRKYQLVKADLRLLISNPNVLSVQQDGKSWPLHSSTF